MGANSFSHPLNQLDLCYEKTPVRRYHLPTGGVSDNLFTQEKIMSGNVAPYRAIYRTNYFAVVDLTKFCKVMGMLSGISVKQRADGKVALVCSSLNGSGWPDRYVDPDDGTPLELNLPDIVSEFLADNQVAIFMEVGSFGTHCLVGFAEAIIRGGERRVVSINDIYTRAMELVPPGTVITNVDH